MVSKKIIIRSLIVVVLSGLLFMLYINNEMHRESYLGYCYLHVTDKSVYLSKIDLNSPQIQAHGHTRDVIRIDEEVDKGDGPKKGKVRWYKRQSKSDFCTDWESGLRTH